MPLLQLLQYTVYMSVFGGYQSHLGDRLIFGRGDGDLYWISKGTLGIIQDSTG